MEVHVMCILFFLVFHIVSSLYCFQGHIVSSLYCFQGHIVSSLYCFQGHIYILNNRSSSCKGNGAPKRVETKFLKNVFCLSLFGTLLQLYATCNCVDWASWTPGSVSGWIGGSNAKTYRLFGLEGCTSAITFTRLCKHRCSRGSLAMRKDN